MSTLTSTPQPTSAPLTGTEARRAFVVSHLPTHKRGLEVAPYFNPMVDRSKYDVFYVDCIDNDEIQRKASENPGGVGQYVPRIDAVWVPGKSLSECVGGRKFAYAVASHVMEHVPNPLGWLHEILECVEVGGRLAIMLPIRTQSMDYYRQSTTFGQVVGWSIEKPSRPTPTQVMDFLSQNFFHRGEAIVEGMMPRFEDASRHYSDSQALQYARFVWDTQHYLDVHCSTWTPETFVEVFTRLRDVGLLNVDVVGPFTGFPGATTAEFLAFLEKRG
ncbi:MAG: methyltransferase domain-containing protein [Planctomycetota bacterium]|nr:MAG: methyltransferase domain-containing protein [Planctomycetota bacterium]